MTVTEMEDTIKNIDGRLTRIEQILPTLATKDDLKAAFDEAEHRARLFYEDLVSRLKTIGEGGNRPRSKQS
jgi:hypothetical protein